MFFMRRSIMFEKLKLIGLIVLFCFVSHSFAVEWDNGAAGNNYWGTADNWNPSGVPDSATFCQVGTINASQWPTVEATSSPAASGYFYLGYDYDGGMTIDGGNLTVNNDFRVGWLGNSTIDIINDGNLVSTSAAYLASNLGDSATINISGSGSSYEAQGLGYFGETGTFEMNVSGGASFTCGGRMFLGTYTDGVATLNLLDANSTVTLNGDYFYPGFNDGASATINISGGTLTTTGYADPGYYGFCDVNMTGGKWILGNGYYSGYYASGEGVLSVSGTAEFVFSSSATFYMSLYGTSELNLSGSGSVDLAEGLMRCGYQGTAVVNISGGTLDNVGTIEVPYSGAGGTATFNMTGGTVNCNGNVVVDANSATGAVYIDGGVMNVGGQLHVATGATGIYLAAGGDIYLASDQTERTRGMFVTGEIDPNLSCAVDKRGVIRAVYDGSTETHVYAECIDDDLAWAGSPADTSTGWDPGVDDPNLIWQAGVGASTHDVYFGESETDVTNGTGGTFIGNFSTTEIDMPVALDYGKTYYYRIDEVGGSTVTGEVWSFSTVGATCDTETAPVSDVNGDCLVNLEDLSIMASEWLDCTIVPSGACP